MSDPTPRWVRWWFGGAAAYGILAIGVASARSIPAAAALPTYAFLGTALAFQIVFALVATDPPRFRPLMLAGVVEKLGFVLPALLLWSDGKVSTGTLLPAAIDLMLGIGFLVAWRATRPGLSRTAS